MVGLNKISLDKFYNITRDELRSTHFNIKKKISKESELKVYDTFHTSFQMGRQIIDYNILGVQFTLNFAKL